MHRTRDHFLGGVSRVEEQGSESVKPTFPNKNKKVRTAHGKEARGEGGGKA